MPHLKWLLPYMLEQSRLGVRGARRGMIASRLATLRHGTNQFEEKVEGSNKPSTTTLNAGTQDDRFEEKVEGQNCPSTTTLGRWDDRFEGKQGELNKSPSQTLYAGT
jgi:hypothetical protein